MEVPYHQKPYFGANPFREPSWYRPYTPYIFTSNLGTWNDNLSLVVGVIYIYIYIIIHIIYIYIYLKVILVITCMKILMKHQNKCQLIADRHGRPDHRPLGSGGVTSLWGPAAERALQIRMHQGWDARNSTGASTLHPHLVLHWFTHIHQPVRVWTEHGRRIMSLSRGVT